MASRRLSVLVLALARAPVLSYVVMEHAEVTDRQLEALLARLDRIVEELARLNAREDRREELTTIAHELRNLNESLQAITYAALGTQGPQIRRRRP
jgi:pyruvate kinase